MAVAALIMGILSLALGWWLPIPYIGWILPILGIIFGAIGIKKTPEKKGMAVAGLVLSIVALAVALIIAVACAAVINEAASTIPGSF